MRSRASTAPRSHAAHRRSSAVEKQGGLHIRPIPVAAEAHHPAVPYSWVLPQHEFSACLIAPKGSGKTTLIANMLDFYKGYFHQIIVFSPTLYSDEKWEYIRKRPLRAENKKLQKFFDKAQNKQGGPSVVVTPSANRAVDKSQKDFDPKIPEDCLMARYDEDTLRGIMEEQMEMIETIQKLGGTKHLADRILFMFDDLVGSSLFSGTRENAFTRLNTNLRHHSASLLMVSQAYKEITKTIRTNTTCLFTFEIPNEAEVRVVYEEHPVSLDKDTWLQMYRFCTEGDYNFMYINYSRAKKLRVMRNFEQVVFAGSDREADRGRGRASSSNEQKSNNSSSSSTSTSSSSGTSMCTVQPPQPHHHHHRPNTRPLQGGPKKR